MERDSTLVVALTSLTAHGKLCHSSSTTVKCKTPFDPSFSVPSPLLQQLVEHHRSTCPIQVSTSRPNSLARLACVEGRIGTSAGSARRSTQFRSSASRCVSRVCGIDKVVVSGCRLWLSSKCLRRLVRTSYWSKWPILSVRGRRTTCQHAQHRRLGCQSIIGDSRNTSCIQVLCTWESISDVASAAPVPCCCRTAAGYLL